MSKENKIQEKYWDSTVADFDSIYSHKKSGFSNFLDRVFRWDMYERYRFTLHQCFPIEGKSVLDLGCGSGRYMIEFGKGNASKVVGLDVAQNMLELSKEMCTKIGIVDRCEFHHTDLIEYETNETYDYSIAIGLFDYTKEPLPIMTKLRELTKTRSVMSFARSNTWRAPVRKVRLGIKKCPVYFFSKSKIEVFLEKAGFKDWLIVKRGALYLVSANV